MRKVVLLILVLALLPAVIFAQLGVGGAAFYKSPVLLGQQLDLNNHNVNQFAFGGDLRFKLGLFQAEGLVFYCAGSQVSGLMTFLDAGLALDVAIVRLSLGAGPNIMYNFNATKPVQMGLNAKIGGDIMLGKVSVGLSYIMSLAISNSVDVNTASGLLGAQILFWM